MVRSIKGLLEIRLAVVFLLLLGCSSAEPPRGESGSGGDSSSLTIAVIPKSTAGEFFETVEVGARQAAEALGVRIKWEGPMTASEIAEQNRIIENMVNLGVDGIALAPLNDKAMRKSVASAVEAGVPVLIFDSAVEGDAHFSFVATNNRTGGGLGGKFLAERLTEGGAKVLLLRFFQGNASTAERVEGFLEVMQESGIEVVGGQYPEDGSIAGCKKNASNAMETFVKDGKLQIDGMFACNLDSALGGAAALEDLRDSGVQLDLIFVGFDTSPRLLEDLHEGHIDALISQDPRRMGYLAVENLVKHLRGEPIESVIDTGVEVVTVERLENEPLLRQRVGMK